MADCELHLALAAISTSHTELTGTFLSGNDGVMNNPRNHLNIFISSSVKGRFSRRQSTFSVILPLLAKNALIEIKGTADAIS